MFSPPPTTQSHPNHQSSSCSLYPPRRPPPPSPLSASRQGSLGDGGGRRGSRPQRCSHLARESVCVCVCMCVCLRAQRVGVCQCTYLALYHLLSLCVCRRFFLFFFFFFFLRTRQRNVCECVCVHGERERESQCVGVEEAQVKVLEVHLAEVCSLRTPSQQPNMLRLTKWSCLSKHYLPNNCNSSPEMFKKKRRKKKLYKYTIYHVLQVHECVRGQEKWEQTCRNISLIIAGTIILLHFTETIHPWENKKCISLSLWVRVELTKLLCAH